MPAHTKAEKKKGKTPSPKINRSGKGDKKPSFTFKKVKK